MPDCQKKTREMSYCACLLSASNEVPSKIILLMLILRYPWLVRHPCIPTESLEDMQDIVELTGTYNSHVYKRKVVYTPNPGTPQHLFSSLNCQRMWIPRHTFDTPIISLMEDGRLLLLKPISIRMFFVTKFPS
jgi:hypothetical protein